MAVSKKTRGQILNKYGGKCAYCGCKLEKKWHIDHLEPIVRDLITGLPKYPERDTFYNYMPSCPSCNIMKNSLPLESFRQLIKGFVASLNRDSTQYKAAKRYGLITEIETPIIFFFEKIILKDTESYTWEIDPNKKVYIVNIINEK